MTRRLRPLAVLLMVTTTVAGCGSKVEISGSHQCEAWEISCNSMCVDTATDSNNCGACEHYCGSAPCNAGACGETPLVVVQSTGELIHGIAADSANIYWATSYALYSMPIEGGMRQVIAYADLMDPFGGPMAAYGGRVYLLAMRNKILAVPVGGGSPEVVASDLEFTSGLAADGTGVYWSIANPGELWRSHGDAHSNELLASGIDNPTGLTLDSEGIYWRTLAGSVMRIPKQGGAPTEVASGASRYLAVTSYGLIYVVENSTETRLMLSPRDGGAVRELLACNGKTNGIAADEQGIYWSGCNRRGVLAFPPGGGAERAVFGGQAGRIIPAGDWLFLLEGMEGSIYRVRRNP